jgi:hypothetical protein
MDGRHLFNELREADNTRLDSVLRIELWLKDRESTRIVDNLLAVIVTFAFCAALAGAALSAINHWERHHESGPHPSKVSRGKDE